MGTWSTTYTKGKELVVLRSAPCTKLAPEYVKLQDQLENSMDETMKALDLVGEPLPLIWTADVIPVDDHISTHVLAEFNCSCVGVGGFLKARGKDSWTDVAADERAQG